MISTRVKKLYTVKTLADFNTSYYSKYLMTEAPNADVAVNQYFFDESTGTASIHTGGGGQGNLRVYVPNVLVGDVVTCTYESMNVSSANGIALRYLETPGRTGTTVYIEGLETAQEQNGQWVRQSFTFVMEQRQHKNLYISVGLLPENSGHIKIRDLRIAVLSSKGTGTGETVDVIKKGEFAKLAGTWSSRTDFVGEALTITEKDTNTLSVQYATPFIGKRPVAVVGSEWLDTSANYVPKLSNSQVGGFEIKFYGYDGVVVPISSVSNGTFVSFVSVGEDYK